MFSEEQHGCRNADFISKKTDFLDLNFAFDKGDHLDELQTDLAHYHNEMQKGTNLDDLIGQTTSAAREVKKNNKDHQPSFSEEVHIEASTNLTIMLRLWCIFNLNMMN